MWNKINKSNLSLLALFLILLLPGCSTAVGPRYWWDDQTKKELPDDYMLPESPPEYPVPDDPAPFVPKDLPEDEVQQATLEEKAQIELGIPRSGVPDPLTNRVVVPAEKYVDYNLPEDQNEEELDAVVEGVAESEESFSEAEADAQAEDEFAVEAESVDDSKEAKNFIDEMNEDYNYNFDEPADEANYNYKDDPTPADSTYEKEEVITDTADKLDQIEGEEEPPLFEPGVAP